MTSLSLFGAVGTTGRTGGTALKAVGQDRGCEDEEDDDAYDDVDGGGGASAVEAVGLADVDAEDAGDRCHARKMDV